MNWPTRTFRMPLNILPVMASFYILFEISKYISTLNLTSKIFQNLGKASLGIMFFHFLGFRLSYIFLWKIGKIEKIQISQLVLDQKYEFWFFIVLIGIFFSLFVEDIISMNSKLYMKIFGKREEIKILNKDKIKDFYIKINQNMIVLITLVVLFFNIWVVTSDNFFVFDDYAWLKTVKYKNIEELFTFLPTTKYNDRPIGAIFIKILYSFFGLEYTYHHLILLTLHIIIVLGVYKFVKKLLKNERVAIFSSLIYGVWPMSTMAFIWNASIFDLLASFFSIIILNLYLFYRDLQEKKLKILVSILIVFCYYLGLRSKEMILTLPTIVLFYELLLSYKNKSNKITGLTICLNIIMVFYLRLLLKLSSHNNITEDYLNPYYQSFNPIMILRNLSRYILLYFDFNNPNFTYINLNKISIISVVIFLFLYLIVLIKNKFDYRFIWLIGCFIGILGPVLPMVNMQHRLYLYLPAIFLSIMVSCCLNYVYKQLKLKESQSILMTILLLFIVNQYEGGKGFRRYWKAVSNKNKVTYNQIKNLKLDNMISNIYISNIKDPTNIFFYGPGDVLRVLGKENLNVYINKEIEKEEFISLIYDNDSGGLKEEKIVYKQPEIKEIFPKVIKRNEIFNEYNSQAVFIIKGKRFSNKSTVLVNDIRLNTTVGKDLITAIVPHDIYGKVGTLEIVVEDFRNDKKIYSNIVEVAVKGVEDEENNNINTSL